MRWYTWQGCLEWNKGRITALYQLSQLSEQLWLILSWPKVHSSFSVTAYNTMACHIQPPFLHFSVFLASATEIRKPKHSTCRVLSYHSSWNSMHEFSFIDDFFLIQNWVTWREDHEHLFGIWIQWGAREESWASLAWPGSRQNWPSLGMSAGRVFSDWLASWLSWMPWARDWHWLPVRGGGLLIQPLSVYGRGSSSLDAQFYGGFLSWAEVFSSLPNDLRLSV